MRLTVHFDDLKVGENPPLECPACGATVLAAWVVIQDKTIQYHHCPTTNMRPLDEVFAAMKNLDSDASKEKEGSYLRWQDGYMTYHCGMTFEYRDRHEGVFRWSPRGWESDAYCKNPKLEVIKALIANGDYGDVKS